MLRVLTADEAAADQLWHLGAVAVVEEGGSLLAGFATDEAATTAARRLTGRWPVVRADEPPEAERESWRAHATVSRVGGVEVVPAWLAPSQPSRGAVRVFIEPGPAFGVGSHPTTRLAVAALADLVRPGDRVVDLGTGTGVLAVIAAALGASEVTAVDTDPEACRVASSNAARNGVGRRVLVVHGTLAAVGGRADVVVANLGGILAPLELAPDLAARTRRALVLSGMLDRAGDPSADPAQLHAALADAGFALSSSATEAGWAAFTYVPASIREFAAGRRHTAQVRDPNKDPKKETRAG